MGANRVSNYKNSTKSGITLIEMLLIIAVMAIIVSIVIVAINPGRQLAKAKNSQRESDIHAIHNAMEEFFVDNLYWPASTTLSSTLTEICDTADPPTPSGCIDLEELIPTYLSAIPVDPSATTTGADYLVALTTGNKLSVTAPNSVEYSQALVAIGTTTPGEGGDEESSGEPSGDVLAFNGSSSRVDASNLPLGKYPTGASEGTISAWIKPGASGRNGILVFGGHNTGSYYAHFQFEMTTNSKLGVSFVPTGASFNYRGYTADSITTDSWNLVTFTINSSGKKLYINGEESSITWAVNISNQFADDIVVNDSDYFVIGLSSYNIESTGYTVSYFDGIIYDVRAYSEALSASEIADLYTGTDPDDTNLDGQWILNEGTGTNAADSIASNDGTISGGATWTTE